MVEGVVVMFKETWGFVSRGEEFEDCFLHADDMVEPGPLRVGDRVRFDLTTSLKGDRAIRAERIEPDGNRA
ncbi:MAG: cold shock domain-containing protein [Acidobacteriota bacterium]